MHCGLSSYHWQILVYLAWFSTVAHMSSLTSIRDYLSTRPWQRNIRFLMTLVLLAMLITALVPTAYFYWSTNTYGMPELQALPAACFFDPTSATRIWDSQYCPDPDAPWHRDYYRNVDPETCTFWATFVGNGPFQSAVFSIFLLVFTFVTRAVKLFDPLSALVSKYLRRPISRLLQRILLWLSRSKAPGSEDTFLAPDTARAARPPSLKQKLFFRLVTCPVLALLLMLRLQVDLFSSMFSEVRNSDISTTLLSPYFVRASLTELSRARSSSGSSASSSGALSSSSPRGTPSAPTPLSRRRSGPTGRSCLFCFS
jgi:hypothetical protein